MGHILGDMSRKCRDMGHKPGNTKRSPKDMGLRTCTKFKLIKIISQIYLLTV